MYNLFKSKIIILGIFLYNFHTQPALATGLTEVLEEALNSSVQISAAKNSLKAQSAGLDQLTALRKPTISANFSGTRDWDLKNDEETSGFSAGITARYLLFDGELTNNKIKADVLRINALEAKFETIKQEVIYDAIISYLNVLRDSRLVELSKKNVSVLEQQLNATMTRFQLGELTRTDVAQAKAALEAATGILASREGVLYLANHTFKTAVGIKPVDLDPKIDLPKLPKTETDAKNLAIKFNEHLRESILLEKRAQSLLDAATSKSWPSLNFSTSLTGGELHSQTNFSNFAFSLTGSMPLYSGGALESEKRKAQAELELSMVNVEITRLRVEQAVVAAWSDYQVASALITARTREVESAQLAYRGTVEETRLGARTTLDVLNAEQTLMDAETSLETAKRNRLASGYRLLLEMGTLTPSILGFDGS